MPGDFDYRILDRVDHRPWPIPRRPWVMTQTWHDLLFAHWPIEADRLSALIPEPLELDVHEGHGWIGIVPFRMTNVAPRAVPAVPGLSAFPELNVRTYVRLGGQMPGVYFFSLDAGSAVAAAAARTLFDLPYFAASMTLVRDAQTVRFASRRNAGADSAACFIASYEPDGRVFHAQTGSLDYFLTERYCLYTVDRARRPHRLDIHHPPWPLQRGVATIQTNTMAQANAIALPAVAAPLLHFAVRQDVVAWLPVRPDGY